jgi:bacterioferritin
MSIASVEFMMEPTQKDRPFLTDVQELRRRAREHIKQGAITPSYGEDPQTVIKILNEALATEIVCTLRYRLHYYMADGFQAPIAKEEFLEHANEEQEHADRIALRIRQLGGTPILHPDTLTSRSHAEFKEGGTLVEMIEEDLIAERIAIDSYREIIQFLGDKDSTSRRLMEEILATEEEHAEDLASLLLNFDPHARPETDARDETAA